MKSRLAILLALLLVATKVAANGIIDGYVPDAKVVGKARYSFLFWDVYDATLLAPAGTWKKDNTFALKLTYLRDFSGADIAKRSIEEMEKQGLSDGSLINQWKKEMTDIFPDVNEDDTLTGIAAKDGLTLFYFGENKVGEVKDAKFQHWFFNIWLGEKTSEPDFRKKLLQGNTQ